MGGVGDGNWSRMVQGKSVDLNDGLPHVAIYSYSAASDRAGNYTQSLMIDGLAVRIHDRLDTPLARGDYEVCVGSCYTENDKWFNGDIAAFRLYGSALSYDDMRELSEAYAAKYGIELMRSDIGFGETRYYGLGAKNVSVGADGVLQLTYASTTPYTLKDGARATGSGQVKGVLGVGADGTLDIGSGLVIESLRVVDGGTLEVPSFQDYTQATVGDLSLSGQIAISIPDNAQVPAGGMVLLQPTGTLSVASGTTFVVEGGVGRYEARVVSGKLRLTTGSGMMIIFR